MCLASSLRWTIIALSALVFLIFISKFSAQLKAAPSSLKVLLLWLQILSLLPSLSDSWPPYLLNLLNFTNLFNFDLGYFGLSCDWPSSYFWILSAKILLPFAVGGVVLGNAWAKMRTKERMLSKKAQLKIFLHCAFVSNFFSIQLLSSMLQIFNCFGDNSGSYRVAQSPDVKCFQKEWQNFLVFDIFMIVFYVLVIPSILIWMYVVARRQGNQKTLNLMVKNLLQGYCVGKEWFEVVRFLFKVGFVLIRDVLALSKNGKISFLCLCLVMLMWCEAGTRPYKDQFQQNLSLLWNVLLISLLVSSSVLNTSSLQQEQTGFAVFLTLCVVLAIFTSVVFTVLQVAQENKTKTKPSQQAPEQTDVVLTAKGSAQENRTEPE
eukprot:TRINITY_DN33608_c0_g1_i3.p1 TRINITY_DN33608_c0_g1~~TRINITY_DN33608_c0_g1_i3.p1  ORF type:complete len:377 (-),score=69.06 TRINITY_DN33608_c0_g1_i3:57-1187(-)